MYIINATTIYKQIAWSPCYIMEYQVVVTLRGSLYLHLTNAPFIWRKLFPGRRFIRTPELPWGRSGGRANFSYISVQSVANDVANRLDDKQTVGLPRGVACLAVTLLVGPTFLHITILSRVKSVKMRQSEYAPPLLSALSSSKGVNVFGSCRCSRKLSQLGE